MAVSIQMEFSRARMQRPTIANERKGRKLYPEVPGTLDSLFRRKEHSFRIADLRCYLRNFAQRLGQVGGCNA